MEVFDQLAHLYQGEHSANPFQAAMTGKVSDLVAPGSTILDLGCGTGVPTAKMLVDAGHSVVGVDISEGMLAHAREQVPAAEFRRDDVATMTAESGSYDAVTSFFMMLMLSRAQIDDLLGKIAGWLKPGGYFAAGMVNIDVDQLPVEFLGVPVKVTGYPETEWKAVLERAGFEVAEIETVEFTPENGPAESQIYALCRVP